MAKHFISNSADFDGEWFLPDENKSRHIAGTLAWSSDHASLQLHESFTPLRGAIYGDEVRRYPVVHGISINSQLITVLETIGAGSGINFGPAGLRQTEKLISSCLIIGAHVGIQTLYSEIRVRIPGLQLWIGKSGIQQTILPKTEESGANVLYRIESLPEEMTEIPCLPATLGWGTDRNFSGDLITEISVISSACLSIRAKEPQELDWFFQQLGKATTLLSFLAGSPMSPDHVSARVASNNIDVEILVALREAKYCTYKRIYDFFMLRNDMEFDLGKVFSNWFELYDTLAMASQLALSVLNSKELWLHVEFLSLMQALEGFHRAIMPSLYTTEEEYKPIRQALCGAIPQTVAADHKEALKSRLKYGNEISLRKRLDALVQRLPISLRIVILGGDGTVPRKWVETRNYYTHWDEASRSTVLDGAEMHRAGVRMRHLLRVLYLDLVGIPCSAIEKSLRNGCNESQYLIQLNNSEYRKNNPGAESGAIMKIDVANSDESTSK